MIGCDASVFDHEHAVCSRSDRTVRNHEARDIRGRGEQLRPQL